MADICFYFQVHQPYRIKNYTVFDIGNSDKYFDSKKNREISNKVAHKCYLPANALMLKLIKKHPEFKISYSISGVALDQFEKYNPKVLESFGELVETGNVELLSETYYHSLAYLYSKKEFKEQVDMHKKRVNELFGVKPQIFRNTELIYNNEIAKYVSDMGYKGIISEGADHVLGHKSPNFLYKPVGSDIKLLMKNYKLSDDIAFRFGERSWKEWPLTVPKYANWIDKINGNGEVVNLFMDYETIGEHQWAESGIFSFMEHLPKEILKKNGFVTPSEAIKKQVRGEIDCHNLMSWADEERDTSAWLGNEMQKSSIKHLYDMEKEVMQTNDPIIINKWRRLTTSDHFYYMCTKWFNDGDVHKYFNPYETPYEAFMNFMNVINDMNLRLQNKNNNQNNINLGQKVI